LKLETVFCILVQEVGAVDVREVFVVKRSGEDIVRRVDRVAIEEPLEVCIDNEPIYTTMRLPGEEVPLALGICFTDGIIASMDDVAGASYCNDASVNKVNLCLSDTRKAGGHPARKRRQLAVYSSCGVCGSDLVADLTRSIPVIDHRTTVGFSDLFSTQKMMVDKQKAHHLTGATHAASLFDGQGGFLAFAEDVGRHNALDKAIGKLLLEGRVREAVIVHLSSRLSYEMVVKAARLGAEIVTGVSAATSLAIETADALGITLIGTLRNPRGNIFTHPDRIL